MSHNAISGIVVETCQAIIDDLGEEYMKCPSTREELKESPKVFRIDGNGETVWERWMGNM